MNIWSFQAIISRRLFRWTALSVPVGLLLLIPDSPFWRAFGIQAIVWGLVAAGIALFGRWVSRRRRAYLHSLPAAEQEEREARHLRRVLQVNTGLDVLYITVGLVLIFTLGAADPGWRGHGWGIIAQGSFLFIFDLFHTYNVPLELASLSWMDFRGPEHQTFLWNGGHPAALLVHGFPGTPAELQPLGKALHRAGWTVQGLLLPGFGPEIDRLGERRWEEWRDAVSGALDALRAEHGPVLLLGYSLGAAIALGAAMERPPDGLVLLAPFLWKQNPWQRFLEGIVELLLPPYLRPFMLVNFANPQFRRGVSSIFPQADLDDPAMLSAIRRTAIPLTLLEQIRLAGWKGYEAVARTTFPVLVIQGSRDEVISPRGMRRLLRRFPCQPRYLEVDVDHDLLSPESRGWPEIERALVAFADDLPTATKAGTIQETYGPGFLIDEKAAP